MRFALTFLISICCLFLNSALAQLQGPTAIQVDDSSSSSTNNGGSTVANPVDEPISICGEFTICYPKIECSYFVEPSESLQPLPETDVPLKGTKHIEDGTIVPCEWKKYTINGGEAAPPEVSAVLGPIWARLVERCKTYLIDELKIKEVYPDNPDIEGSNIGWSHSEFIAEYPVKFNIEIPTWWKAMLSGNANTTVEAQLSCDDGGCSNFEDTSFSELAEDMVASGDLEVCGPAVSNTQMSPVLKEWKDL